MPERGSLDALFWKALLVAGALWLLYLALHIVLLALVALVLAAAMLPLADTLQKRRVPRAVTVAGVYTLGLGLLALLVTLLVPVFGDQVQILSDRLPEYRQTLNDWIASGRAGLGRFTGGRPIQLPEITLDQIRPFARALVERSLEATRGVLTGTLAGLLILFVAGYIVIDRRRMAEGLSRYIPRGRRERTAHVAAAVLKRMGGYVRGQLMVGACAAAILSLGLLIIGFQAPLLVGVLAGSLNFIPYLGSTVSFVVALLLALSGGPFTTLGVVAVFVAEQFVEGNFLVPYFIGRHVDLHPLAVFAALLVGASLAGALGALVAVPLAAGLDAVLQETYVKRLERSA